MTKKRSPGDEVWSRFCLLRAEATGDVSSHHHGSLVGALKISIINQRTSQPHQLSSLDRDLTEKVSSSVFISSTETEPLMRGGIGSEPVAKP